MGCTPHNPHPNINHVPDLTQLRVHGEDGAVYAPCIHCDCELIADGPYVFEAAVCTKPGSLASITRHGKVYLSLRLPATSAVQDVGYLIAGLLNFAHKDS